MLTSYKLCLSAACYSFLRSVSPGAPSNMFWPGPSLLRFNGKTVSDHTRGILTHIDEQTVLSDKGDAQRSCASRFRCE